MGGLQSIGELNWHGGLRGRVLSHKQTHAGKLAAEVVIDKAMGVEPKPDKKIQDRCFSSRDLWTGCPARQDSACLAQAIGRSPASLPAHVLLCPSSPWPRGPHTISRLTSINASGAAACHCFLRSYCVPPGHCLPLLHSLPRPSHFQRHLDPCTQTSNLRTLLPWFASRCSAGVCAWVNLHRHPGARTSVYAAAEAKVAKEPTGLLGDGAIVFGGGAVFNKKNKVPCLASTLPWPRALV